MALRGTFTCLELVFKVNQSVLRQNSFKLRQTSFWSYSTGRSFVDPGNDYPKPIQSTVGILSTRMSCIADPNSLLRKEHLIRDSSLIFSKSSSSVGNLFSVSRGLATNVGDPKPDPVKSESTEKVSEEPSRPLTNKEKIKRAVRDYGVTVLVFHISMSLTILGITYLLVSSGLDVVSILDKVGVGKSILESKLTQEAGTFVVAYACYKVTAPVRIGITLSVTPILVNYLRRVGFLKKPRA